MTATDTPLAYKFVQADYYSPSPNGTITRIVIHDEEVPVSDNSAESVANYFATAKTGSAHYCVDGNSVVQCVRESQTAYHAPPNHGSIGIEHDGYARFTTADWAKPGSQATLARSAVLVRDIAARHGVPLVRLSVADLLAGKRGICGHVDVSQAWHQSDHVDPGRQFPWDQFMRLVTASPAPHGNPSPTPQPVQEDDMKLVKGDGQTVYIVDGSGARVVSPSEEKAYLAIGVPEVTIDAGLAKSFHKSA